MNFLSRSDDIVLGPIVPIVGCREDEYLVVARKHNDPNIRLYAAKKDCEDKKDMSWARTDPSPGVRYYAAVGDYETNLSLAWAKMDPTPEIKTLVEYQKTYRRKVYGLDEKE